MHRPTRRLALLAACCALSLGSLSAHASDWPTAKPITWVVPFAAGGSTDARGCSCTAIDCSREAGTEACRAEASPCTRGACHQASA